MVYRRVLEWPDKKLKLKSRDFVLNEDKQVYEDLLDTFNVTGGYGLSAPQIGFSIRVIVINEKLLKQDENLSNKLVMINPEVVSTGEKALFKEGCFSLPTVELDIKRFSEIEVSWLNIDGSKDSGKFEGYSSACVQHEIDHLDGILTIDKISQLRRSLFIKKYKKRKLLESKAEKSKIKKKPRRKKKKK